MLPMAEAPVPVTDYMSDLVHSVLLGCKLEEAYERLDELDVSALAVIDPSRKPVGVVSRTDLVRSGRRQPRASLREHTLEFPDQTVAEIMRPGVVTLSLGASMAEAADAIVSEGIHRIFISDGDELVGVLSTLDLMQASVDMGIETPIGDLMSEHLVVVHAAAPTTMAIDRMAAEGVHAIVVVEGQWPIGSFGQVDALIARELPPSTPVEACMDPAILCLPLGMPIFRAVAHALAMDVEQILAMDETGLRGILSGIDIAKSLTSASVKP